MFESKLASLDTTQQVCMHIHSHWGISQTVNSDAPSSDPIYMTSFKILQFCLKLINTNDTSHMPVKRIKLYSLFVSNF